MPQVFCISLFSVKKKFRLDFNQHSIIMTWIKLKINDNKDINVFILNTKQHTFVMSSYNSSIMFKVKINWV